MTTLDFIYNPLGPAKLSDPFPVCRRMREFGRSFWDERVRSWVLTSSVDYRAIRSALGSMLHAISLDPLRLNHLRTAEDFERWPNIRLTFGCGVHACTGSALSHLRMLVALTVILSR